MSSELKQTIATGITTAAGVTFVFNAIPYVLGITATTVGIMASWAIYKERKIKSRLNELMITQEEKRQGDIKGRRKKDLPLRREGDKKDVA